MLLIFSPQTSLRLDYILNFIFGELLGIDFLQTNNEEEFHLYKGPRINYSRQSFSNNSLWIASADILFEKSIKEQEPAVKKSATSVLLFPASQFLSENEAKHAYAFDIFAASFYLLARYEEYLLHKKDMYGRYAHENSMAFKESFLNTPLINIWVNKFCDDLLKKFPGIKTNLPLFSFLPTYDIDIAFSFKSKGLLRNVGGAIKSLMRGKNPEIVERVKSFSKDSVDPFDVYEELDEIHTRFKLRPLYFFLVAEKNSVYDKNILPEKAELQSLIRETSKKYSIGLHPSWSSGDNERLFRKEKQVLENISDRKISQSRHHYVRFILPEDYRKMLSNGIKDEYSMGYGSINGFRASVASSHFWFDLEKNEATNLRIHPFCYMDANSLYEEKLTPAEALEEMLHYFKLCKEVDGRFIGIWHNHLLGRSNLYKGWKEAYFTFLLNISETV